MKGYSLWSYRPYKPLLYDTGDIYICRIAPDKDKIHLEWIACIGECSVYFRKRGEGDFTLAGKTSECEYTISHLADETDYEFFVQGDMGKSRVRIARTGAVLGTVVNYLHPDDEAYAFSGRYLCSPSLLMHPDGYLLASMDVFRGNSPQNLTLIFRSDDGGKTWHHLTELMPCFWGKLFLHKGEVYMLACSTEYGDLLIGKSTDGGATFGAPTVLLRGANGKNGSSGVHKNPQNIVSLGGRLYTSLEWGSWANKEYHHAAMVMSCDENADLLLPESWSFTEPVPFTHFAPEVSDVKLPAMTIEGTPVIAPDGRLLNIMRFSKRGYALCYSVNTQDAEAALEYSHIMEFPANFSKFMIKYDEVSGAYYSIVCRLWEDSPESARNYQTLMRSHDLKTWVDAAVLYDFRHMKASEVGLQYVDFSFEGDDIIYLCRTAWNGASNFHDANYSTFHRIKNFRKL